MGITAAFRVSILAIGISIALADDSCPSKAELAPCTCDGEGVSCMGPIDINQIRKAFKGNFKYGGVRSIWIQATRLTLVPADLINRLKIQEAYIEVNNVTSVDLNAFSGAQNTLVTLSLFGNKISNLDFQGFAKFTRLTVLNLGQNELTTIPENAFGSYYVGTLILAENKISSIGRNAFQQLVHLSRLELAQNRLVILGPGSMSNPSQNLQLNLAANRISNISTTAFEGSTPKILILAANRLTSIPYNSFGGIVTRMAQTGGLIDVTANPLTCKGCDYTWLVNNKYALSRMILGFMCPDHSGMDTLTRNSIGC